MTKKHFDAVAAALHDSKPIEGECFACLAELERWEKITLEIVHRLVEVCPNINYARFLKACGYKQD